MRAQAESPPIWTDALLVGAAAGGLYLALGQDVLYGDAIWLLLRMHQGEVWHHFHLAYLPMVRFTQAVLSPLHVSLFEAARLLSEVGAAVGVAACFAAARLGGGTRRQSWAVAALVATVPSLVFFATVMELHGPFFGFAGLALLSASWLALRPTAARAITVGLATAAAFLAHASGIVLPLVVLPWALVCAPPTSRAKVMRLCAVAGLVHGILVLGVPPLLRALAGTETTVASVAGIMEDEGGYVVGHPLRLLGCAWSEWLLPFAPLSVLWLPGLRRAELRPLAAWLAAAWGVYLLGSALALGPLDERGAYLLPLAFPAAVLAVRSVGVRASLAAASVALAVATVDVRVNEAAENPAAFAAGVRAVAHDHPVALLVGSRLDIEACFVALPAVPFAVLPDFDHMQEPEPPSALAARLHRLDATIAGWWGEGRAVLASEVAASWYGASTAGISPVLRHLARSYRFEPVRAAGFRGWRVLPLPDGAAPLRSGDRSARADQPGGKPPSSSERSR